MRGSSWCQRWIGGVEWSRRGSLGVRRRGLRGQSTARTTQSPCHLSTRVRQAKDSSPIHHPSSDHPPSSHPHPPLPRPSPDPSLEHAMVQGSSCARRWERRQQGCSSLPFQRGALRSRYACDLHPGPAGCGHWGSHEVTVDHRARRGTGRGEQMRGRESRGRRRAERGRVELTLRRPYHGGDGRCVVCQSAAEGCGGRPESEGRLHRRQSSSCPAWTSFDSLLPPQSP